jgi:hypothetical protein
MAATGCPPHVGPGVTRPSFPFPATLWLFRFLLPPRTWRLPDHNWEGAVTGTGRLDA